MIRLLFVLLCFVPACSYAFDYDVTGKQRTGEDLMKVRGMQWNWGPHQIPEQGKLVAKTKNVLLEGSETRRFEAVVGDRNARISYQFFEGELFAIQTSLSPEISGEKDVDRTRFLDYLEFNDILISKYGKAKDISIWYDPKLKDNMAAWLRAYEDKKVSFINYWFVDGIEVSHNLPKNGLEHSIWYIHAERHNRVLNIIAQGRKDEL